MVLPRPNKEEEDPFTLFPSIFYSIIRGSGSGNKIQIIKDSDDPGAFQKFALEEVVAPSRIPQTILLDSQKAAFTIEVIGDALDIDMIQAGGEEEFTGFIEEIFNLE